MIDPIKQQIFAYVDTHTEELCGMADQIFDCPELAFEEFEAIKLLMNYLSKHEFVVEAGVGTLPTAFRAVYQNKSGGPRVGLLCEYDALEGMGHGCAHHIQGPAIAGAAQAIKEIVGDLPYTLVVYGTPGEEGGGGKITMLANDCFNDIDVALMTHGGPATQTDVKSLAMASLRVTFYGKSTHAALKPESGRSALDGLLLCFHGVEFLREHVLEDTRMHYTVSNAGGPANVVPAIAVGDFAIRSYNSCYLDEVIGRFEDVVKGAALMSGTTYEIITTKRLESKVPVASLNRVLMDNAELVDAPNRKPARLKTGSTDFGNVTYVLPGACVRIAFVPEGTSSHSTEFVEAGKTESGHNATVYAAKILAGATYDMILNPALVKQFKEEFDTEKNKLKAK